MSEASAANTARASVAAEPLVDDAYRIAVAAVAAAIALHRGSPRPPSATPTVSAWTALARAEALRR